MGLPPGRRGKERCKVMDKLQMAHDFSMEVLLKIQEASELLMPIVGLISIIILCIILTIVITIFVVESIQKARNKR
jgi:hypothetical protein